MIKNNKCKIIISLTFLAFLFALMVMGYNHVTDALILSCIVLLTGAFVIFKYEFVLPKKIVLFSGALSILFILQLSYLQIFERMNFDSVLFEGIVKFLFFIVLLFSCYIIISFLLMKIYTKNIYSASKSVNDGKRIYFALIPIAITTIFFLIYSYPGYIYPDMVDCWNWSMLGQWNEWHTIGYLLYLKVFCVISDFLFLVLAAQGVFWVLIQCKAIHLLYSLTNSKKSVWIYSIVSCVIFTPILYCGMLIKDTIFCECLFLFVLCILDLLNLPQQRITTIISLIVSAIGVCIFRHAGFVPVVVSLIFILIYSFVQKKRLLKISIIISMIFVLLSSFFINTVLPEKILNAIPNPQYITYTVPMYQIGAVCNKVDDISQEDLDIIEQIMPLEKWREIAADNRYLADSIAREYGEIGEDILKLNDSSMSSQIIKLNAKWLFKYPKEYLSSFFDISSILWEIGRPSDGYEWAPLYGGAIDSDYGNSSIRQTAVRYVLERVAEFTLHNPVLRSVYWRGGLWLFMSVFSGVILLLKKQYKNLLAFVPPTIVSLLLFLSIPAQDPRYILFLLSIGLFVFIMSLFMCHRVNVLSGCSTDNVMQRV